MDRLTHNLAGEGIPRKFDLDFVLDIDDKTWRGFKDIINRLAAYEDTGREPNEISALDHDVAMLKQSANLPVIDYSGWTIPQQVRKIGEEYGEVVEALLEGNPVEVIRESLDCMQTHWTLIQMVAGEYRINIDRLYQEHCRKLARKGYLKEEEV